MRIEATALLKSRLASASAAERVNVSKVRHEARDRNKRQQDDARAD
jgi:hypothetical protein